METEWMQWLIKISVLRLSQLLTSSKCIFSKRQVNIRTLRKRIELNSEIDDEYANAYDQAL